MSLLLPPTTQSVTAEVDEVARRLLPTAEALADECFANVRDKQVSWQSDPEVGERWLELQIAVAGEPDQVVDDYNRFAARWVAAVPWPEHNWVRLVWVIV